MSSSKRILLSVPAETATGGIKNYFRALKGKFLLPVDYTQRGARNWPFRGSAFAETKRFFADIIEFRRKIRTKKYALVQTSTSLGFESVVRDGIFLWIAQANGVKTIVFFRGWDKHFETKIEERYLKRFKRIFFKADLLIVLSPEFKDTLVKWGYQKEIIVETTLIDNDLIRSFDLEKNIQDKQNKNSKEIHILFLARTEVDKGIYEAINAYNIVKNNHPEFDISLTIAGDGIEFENMKNYLLKTNCRDVTMLGNVEGKEKVQAFLEADIYLFPSYTEGMPNSVLEAMAFGLPVVASSVGAIPFIIENGVNGYHTDSLDPTVFASILQKLVNSKDLRMQIARNNFLKAKEEFYSEKVVKRIEDIYTKLLNEADKINA